MSEQITVELVRADEVREGDLVWWEECWALCDLAHTDVLDWMGETTLRLARNEGKGSKGRHGLSSSMPFLRVAAASPVPEGEAPLGFGKLSTEYERGYADGAAAPVSDAKEREKLSRAIGLAESIARIPGLGYEVNKQGVYEIAAEIVELLHAVSGEDR